MSVSGLSPPASCSCHPYIPIHPVVRASSSWVWMSGCSVDTVLILSRIRVDRRTRLMLIRERSCHLLSCSGARRTALIKYNIDILRMFIASYSSNVKCSNRQVRRRDANVCTSRHAEVVASGWTTLLGVSRPVHRSDSVSSNLWLERETPHRKCSFRLKRRLLARVYRA